MQLSLNFQFPFFAEPLDETDIASIFQSVYRGYLNRSWKINFTKNIHVEFFAYRGLKHVLRFRDDEAHVRISHHAKGQNTEFFEALAHVLWARVFRKKCDPVWEKTYKDYETQLAHKIPESPSVKRVFDSRGVIFDLEEIKSRLDLRFFGGHFNAVKIGWSRQSARTRLGHYDFGAAWIVITKILDHPEIPSYVVEYIVYHEMLHHIHRPQNGRIHTREFNAAEKLFPDYRIAKTWINETYPKFLRRNAQ